MTTNATNSEDTDILSATGTGNSVSTSDSPTRDSPTDDSSTHDSSRNDSR